MKSRRVIRLRRRLRRWWKHKALKWHPRRHCEEHGRSVRWSTGKTRSRTGSVFCSAACKAAKAQPTKAYREAKIERLRAKCPRPDKQRFGTEAECRLRFATLLSVDPHLHPYLCRCGQWHAGHSGDHIDPVVLAALEAMTGNEDGA